MTTIQEELQKFRKLISSILGGYLVLDSQARNGVIPHKNAMDLREKMFDECEAFLASALRRIQEGEREKVSLELYQLDWIKILDNAIKSRRTSWGEDIVREWRNASDEVLGAMMSEAEKKKLFKSLRERLDKDK